MAFHPTLDPTVSLMAIHEDTTIVAPPPAPLITSPLKQLHAPPVPFVPRSELYPHNEPYSSTSSLPVELSPEEFCNSRPSAPAIFSTKNGTRAKRELARPYPAPIVRTDILGDVAIRSNQLLEEFQEARDILNVPLNWFMLHDFFDAHDLWVEGAEFCFHVMLAISGKNSERLNKLYEERNDPAQVSYEQRVVIDLFAGDWVSQHGYFVMNNPNVEKMTTLFNEADRAELIGMTQAEIALLDQALAFHRHNFADVVAQQTRPRMSTGAPFAPLAHGKDGHPAPETRNTSSRSSMVPPSMSCSHRVRRDSFAIVPSRTATDQQIGRRSSMQGQQGHNIQGHGGVIDTRRQITPNDHRMQGYNNEFQNMNGSFRRRGHSNSSQNFHGRDVPYNHSQASTRRYPSHAGGRSSGNTPSKEPSYFRQTSTSNANATHISDAHRVVSDPAPIVPFCSAKRLGSGVRQAISPRNRERNSSNYQTISTSPTGNEDLRTPRQHPRGSSATQSPRTLSGSPTNRKSHSNDARANATTEREYPWMEQHETNSSITFHYKPGGRDLESLRTLHISGFHQAMIYDHFLKGLMEECGQVISIHFLPLGVPRAFVTFVESSAVQVAILRFNRLTLHTGHTLSVGLPNNLDQPRAGSNASQTYRNGHFNSSRDVDSRSRRPSFRNSSNVYYIGTTTRRSSVVQNPRTPPRLLIDQLQSTISEVVQHQSALERNTHLPLRNIENIHSPSSVGDSVVRTQQQVMPQTGSNKKENNSPSKNAGSQENRERFSPRRDSSNKKGSYKHQKGSKHNTSTRPTPAITPVKSNSLVDLKEAGQVQIYSEVSSSSIGDGGRAFHRNGVKKPNLKPRNLHNSSKSDGSFNTDANSDATLSPLDSTPMTRDTSFSAGSGRKHSQPPSSKLMKSQSATDVPSLAGAGPTKPKSKKSNKPRGPKHASGSKAGQVKSALNNLTRFSKGDETDIKKIKKSITGHSKKGSGASAASNNSLKKADQASTVVASSEARVATPSPESVTQVKSEVVTSNIVPVGSTSVGSDTLSPRVSDTEWPSLTESQLITSDFEHLPPPIMGSLTSSSAGNKKSTKPTVPTVAVPRAFETRPQQPLRGCALGVGVGTETWPFVRKCKAK